MTETIGPRIYNLFPLLAGTTADWARHLPRIAAMGFDWVYLNPIHYPGFSGSLYATKEYDRLNPLFDDGSGRGMGEQVASFVREAEARGIRVMLDLVVNHTSKDCPLAEAHPGWYRREADGSLYSPRAYDPDDPDDLDKATVWGDLAELDFAPRPERDELVGFFSEVVRRCCVWGVHGFRCDAAYKVPAELWSALISSSRRTSPEVAFFAETLGCRSEEVVALRKAGFDFVFNSSKWWDFDSPWLMEQYESYRHIAPSISFPESHDTERLGTEPLPQGADAAARHRLRYAFAAIFSTGVMMPIGYEFGFGRKLDVVSTRPDWWEEPVFDLTGFVGALNAMRAAAPPLNEEGPQTLHRAEERDTLALLRRTEDGLDWCLSVVNPSLAAATTAWAEDLLELTGGEEGVEVTPGVRAARLTRNVVLTLPPATVRVFRRAVSMRR